MNIQKVLNSHGIKSIWHFTDKSNLETISKHGILSLREIIKSNVTVHCYGANNLSHSLDISLGLDKFVHLSFVKDHPMYYIAKRDGRIVTPIWLEIDLSVLHVDNTIFSDEVANKNGASRFGADKLERMIDFDSLMYPKDFSTKVKVRKAEIMVANNITLDSIRGVYYGS